jgi:carbonic anhydrase
MSGYVSVEGKYLSGEEINYSFCSTNQASIHTPSEHTIGGKHFAAEIQVEFAQKDGRDARVAIFFDNVLAGNTTNEFLNSIYFEKPEIFLNDPSPLFQNLLEGAGSSLIYYEGTATVGDFHPVSWFILRNPQPISEEQIALLKSKIVSKNRPV